METMAGSSGAWWGYWNKRWSTSLARAGLSGEVPQDLIDMDGVEAVPRIHFVTVVTGEQSAGRKPIMVKWTRNPAVRIL